MKKILEIINLSISFTQYYRGFHQKEVTPVNGLNLTVNSNEILAIVGASGSGKSLLAHAILGILPTNSKVGGSIIYQNELLTIEKVKALRGKEIRFIPQSVQYLNPTRKIGKQLEECFEIPTKENISNLLKEFSLEEKVFDYYPYELSGGMLRRVLFSTCRGKGASLIIADEPTPGIHPKALQEILEQFVDFRKQGISIVFITHDMKSAMQIADRVAIFKDGKVVGTYTPKEIREENNSVDSYTRKLWETQPSNKFWEAIV
ncbi:ATP-binding cassette domain-containing protein [Fusobacterium necrophorum]|uniref:ATP-binding cassette domain-containing protein n=1 Tax=Fusobacterium necrophorum TaxID=859 RepID=UPI00254F5B9F|nr:ATP-binding cassette domain-containing protein [Fusobacterium necrophorum]MDK4501318.1 ATP-binding cassette domain-containing protein [Fusobacterium necrophorum]